MLGELIVEHVINFNYLSVRRLLPEIVVQQSGGTGRMWTDGPALTEYNCTLDFADNHTPLDRGNIHDYRYV